MSHGEHGKSATEPRRASRSRNATEITERTERPHGEPQITEAPDENTSRRSAPQYDTQLPQRALAQACGLGLGTVSTCLQRATAAGLTWPLPDDLDDATLEARLFTGLTGHATQPTIDKLHA